MGRKYGRDETGHKDGKRMRGRNRMEGNTKTRLYKLALLILLVILYKVLVYMFSSAVWLLCARIVLLGIILVLLLNLLFPSK